MSQVREIKCPHCGRWTLWNGGVDDRCLYCAEFIEPKRFSREVERKIRIEVAKERDYFFIKPTDNRLKRIIKRILNYIRWYVSFLLVLISFFVG
jgi:hypothetical protein